MKYTFTDINNVWLSILNAEGDEFKSFLKAEEFMKADPRYSETHLEQLKLLVEEKAIERRLSDPAWRKDSSVPKGWKLRPASDSKSKSEKEFLLSKDGRQFPGRRVALKAMVEEMARMKKEVVQKTAFMSKARHLEMEVSFNFCLILKLMTKTGMNLNKKDIKLLGHAMTMIKKNCH